MLNLFNFQLIADIFIYNSFLLTACVNVFYFCTLLYICARTQHLVNPQNKGWYLSICLWLLISTSNLSDDRLALSFTALFYQTKFCNKMTIIFTELKIQCFSSLAFIRIKFETCCYVPLVPSVYCSYLSQYVRVILHTNV